MPRIDATECTDDVLMQYLSPLEIYNQIHKQPNKKAAGPDGITYEVLKQILDSALFLIHDLFNYYFDQGDLPETWKNGYIIPLYKGKGPKKDANSYRGIALLSCMYKIFAGLIQNRLYCWTEEKHFLPDSQFGFRRGLPTLDAAESLIKEIKRHVDSIGRAYVCFVDFAKAFDSVNRDLLLRKLYFYGVKGRVFNTICSLLEKTTSSVAVEDRLTTPILSEKGVPQGDNLSPLLFTIFISDLTAALEKTGCRTFFYADDLAITANVIDDLKLCMEVLSKYCYTNSLQVNVTKTKAMKFQQAGRIAECERVFYRNEEIEYVNSFEYLGIILSTQLSFNVHLKHLRKKSANAANSLLSKMDVTKISYQSAQKLVKSVIYPSAVYGCELFRPHTAHYKDTFLQHIEHTTGYFWKRWCGISYRWSSKQLLSHLISHDYLNINNCSPLQRRPIALYYSNGLHHLICTTKECYKIQPSCVCPLCHHPISESQHLDLCTSLDHLGTTRGKLFNVYYETVKHSKLSLY